MNRYEYEQAMARLFFISLIPLVLGIWRMAEGEWVAGSILWVVAAIIGTD